MRGKVRGALVGEGIKGIHAWFKEVYLRYGRGLRSAGNHAGGQDDAG